MAIKFTDDTATHLRFPFGDYREVEGMFGPQFLYTVEGSGRADRLYASFDLHRAIQEAGINPGSELRIMATRGDRRRLSWLVTRTHTPKQTHSRPSRANGNGSAAAAAERDPLREKPPSQNPRPGSDDGGLDRHQPSVEAAEGKEVAQQAASDPPADRGEDDSPEPLPKELEQMGRLMGFCLHASSMAWSHVIRGRQSAGDIRAVGITLFLECSRRGVTIEEALKEMGL